MKLAVLAPLEQRTALRFTMPGMTSIETSSYIKHHLGTPAAATNCSPMTP
jgi:type II secretory pathway predicted ATPase ExeA